MKILLKTTEDIKKISKILDNSELYYYRAYLQKINGHIYVNFSILERK